MLYILPWLMHPAITKTIAFLCLAASEPLGKGDQVGNIRIGRLCSQYFPLNEPDTVENKINILIGKNEF
jgi:hypothetical protein